MHSMCQCKISAAREFPRPSFAETRGELVLPKNIQVLTLDQKASSNRIGRTPGVAMICR
jgi:hypothetical protein